MRSRVGRGGAKASLASVFLSASPAFGAPLSPGEGGYLIRLLVAALLLGGLLFFLSRLSRGAWFRSRFPAAGRCRLLGTLPLGRDSLYLILCGPEVIAVLSGKGGTVVVGRWDKNQWEEAGPRDEV